MAYRDTTEPEAPTAEPGGPTEADEAIVAVLAGGAGRRVGGDKAMLELGGTPLIARPIAAGIASGREVVVIAKPDSALPDLEVPVWLEPAEPRHPLAGIAHALRHGGRPVVAVACDMPFVTPELLSWLGTLSEQAVVPQVGGRLQPLIARYGTTTLAPIERALHRGGATGAAVAGLAPRLVGERELSAFGPVEQLLLNVNTREDLRRARGLLQT
jgi:molybdopterin-guanine dinucleotide biosynthesis protein A